MITHLRDELREHIWRLSNLDYQHQVWIGHNFPPGVQYDEVDFTIHFLFDDTRLADDTDNMIGVMLKNEEEVSAIRHLLRALDDSLKYDIEHSLKAYIDTPEWKNVIESAQSALKIMQRSDMAE